MKPDPQFLKPFVAGLARYSKLLAQLRHRKVTALRQIDKSLFLFHR